MSKQTKSPEGITAETVVSHVRAMIERGELKPGGRLPPERVLASQIGVSRPSVRAGLQALAAMGVVQARHGAGTFITDGPPVLGTEPLSFMAALHGFTRSEMFEAREVLEVGAVALAARRATGEDLANVAEEMASMYASLTDPQTFLFHDIKFHQAVAKASHNPILASLIEMVSAMFYERRRQNIGAPRDLRTAAEMHRVIYHALRDRDPDGARHAMVEHLAQSQAQSVGDLEKGAVATEPVASPSPSRSHAHGSDARAGDAAARDAAARDIGAASDIGPADGPVKRKPDA